jgi:hypothetical protein
MIKKLLFCLLLSCSITTTLYSEEPRLFYVYDNAGNRISRLYSEIPPPEDSEDEEASTTTDAEILSERIIKIYPNPTEGILTVEIVNFTNDLQAEFLLTDLSGKVINRQKATSGYQTFNLSNQPAGIYLLRIQINGENTTWKIIKE